MVWILTVITVAACLWAAVSFKTARQNGPLTTGQYLVFLLVPIGMTAGIGTGSYSIALAASQQSAVNGYQQFLNGSIVEARSERVKCARDGACGNTYSCDPYEVPRTVMDYDSKGNLTGSHTEYDTYYHSCPYATEEISYSLTDSIAFKGRDRAHSPSDWQHTLTANPVKWRKNGNAIPKSIPRGVPAVWQHAKDALARGDSDPITVKSDYANYILASEKTILKAYSDDIDLLQGKKLLPAHTKSLEDPIVNVTRADKMSFVGFTPKNEAAWQDALMRLNAMLGSTKQGDMHIVAIKASAIPSSVSSQDYLNALKAYWLNGLGKNALAKNGIALVLAVDDSASNIVWARATTGMPVGNGAMLQALNTQLSDAPFTVDTVLGTATGRVDALGDKPKVVYAAGSGVIPTVILQEFPFQRACMDCSDDEGQNGFVNLSSEIPLGGWSLFWAIVIDLLLCGAIIWLLEFLCVTYWNAGREDFGSFDRYSRIRERFDSQHNLQLERLRSGRRNTNSRRNTHV